MKKPRKRDVINYIMMFIFGALINTINRLIDPQIFLDFHHEMNVIGTLLLMVLLGTIAVIIHEYGHVMFVKLFGGEVTEIHIGSGKIICKYRNFQIHTFFYNGGYYRYKNLKKDNKRTRILIHLGGVILNVFCACLSYFLLLTLPKEFSHSIKIFFWMNEFFISALLPISYRFFNSDGLQIYQILRYGKSQFYVKPTEV